MDVTRYSFSWKAIGRRIGATQTMIPKWMNVVRAVSTEGFGRIKYHTEMRRRLDTDRAAARVLRAGDGRDPDVLPGEDPQDLGPLYEYLPEGALVHDPNAYLNSQERPELLTLAR